MRSSDQLTVTSLNQASCGAVLWRQAGVLWATVIVKATFRLVHDATAEIVDPLDIVFADRPRSPTGSLEASDEAVPRLPNACVVLAGSACAPAGQSIRSAAVRLGVSGERKLIDKTLHVFGEPAEPGGAAQPFQKLPVLWERAYGGPSFADNPVGSGAAPGSPPPSIIDPADARRPAGFGPIAQEWPARRHLLGSVDPAALDATIPEIPAATDWRYFNPAPQDQQVDALNGNEWIVLDGMHPTLPRVQTRLPGAIARAEWRASSPAGGDAAHALELRADMLVIDADRMLCSVVWRGRFAVAQHELTAGIHVAAGVELPGSRSLPASATPAGTPLAETGALDLRAMLPAALPFATKPKPPAARRAPVVPAPTPLPSPDVVLTQELPGAQDLAGTQGVDMRAMRMALPFGAGVPGKPSPASIPGPRAKRAPQELSATGGLDVHLLLKPTVPFSSPPPPEPDDRPTPSPPALLSEPVASAPAPVEPAEEDDDEQDDDGPLDVRAEVIDRLAAGRSLLNIDLVGADLHDLDFAGRLLSGLDLRRANLRGARFCGVRLTGADLGGADLTDAVLSGADISRANLAGASVTRAQLDGAVLVDANLSGVHGADANLVGADMRRARLCRAKLPGARFDGADLREADIGGVALDEGALANARRGKGRKQKAANDGQTRL